MNNGHRSIGLIIGMQQIHAHLLLGIALKLVAIETSANPLSPYTNF